MADQSFRNLQESLKHQWPAVIFNTHTEADLLDAISKEINFLIQQDFPKLIQLLYRIDVSEKKLRLLLGENQNAEASRIIAGMIIDRQKQKLAMKDQQSGGNSQIPDDERW